jgi:hypothetical protein
VCEDFILDDGGVVLYEYVLNGESRDLSNENASESVGERGVEADEGERSIVRIVSVELDGERRLEPLNCKGVVLAGEMAREICGRNIGDCLFVDADGLDKDLLY